MAHTHYDTLKVARDAPTEVIRAAYRALSLKLHPDRNPGDSEAAQSMSLLNAAYDVLSDPDKRSQYDELMESVESASFFDEAREAARSPQRWTIESLTGGGQDDSQRARLFTHLRIFGALGGIALVAFLVWSKGPVVIHRDIELPQPSATSPYVFQDPTLPQAAARASAKSTPSQSQPAAAPGSDESTAVRGLPSRSAGVASPPLLDEPAAEAAEPFPALPLPPPPPPARVEKKPAPQRRSSSIIDPDSKLHAQPAELGIDFASASKGDSYMRPAQTPNGNSWPSSSDYVLGYQQLNTDGLSQVIIDNSQNDFDAFVKVISVADGGPETVRTVFLSSRDRFTVTNLRAGTYEIRYQNLDSGTLLKSGAFALEESAIAGGTRHSTVTLVLHAKPNDAMNTYLLSEREF